MAKSFKTTFTNLPSTQLLLVVSDCCSVTNRIALTAHLEDHCVILGY